MGLLVVAALVIAGVSLLLYERHQLELAHARWIALRCDSGGDTGPACTNADNAAFDIRGQWSNLALAILALPGLVGAVLAAQPLAADLERGRHLLLWSQSVSPRRWLSHRLALPAVVLLVLSTVLSVAVRWAAYWSHPQPEWNETYGSHDLVPVYPVLTLAALALGASVGLTLRRVIPALGVTLFLYGVLVFVIEQVRPYLMPLHFMVLSDGSGPPQGAWVESIGVVLNGKPVSFSQCWNGGCGGHVPTWVRFHPPSEFSPMLWIETGILAALTAVLLVLAYRRLAALTR
ncbi:hypothetical protein DN069_03260 [Streptacidiphilus pinicola]|uniref:ABC transporter permease n=1 Tax=Streptacidiphilus pinicola TaxID=2219663 RepID=A0A2X0KD54_9ACTN|nr:hypothetical protein DN069_03260 [Streptacidiphilus pinicola]